MAYIYVKPSDFFESSFEGAPPGLIGTIGYRIINLETNITIAARTTSEISEIPTGSGTYYAKVSSPETGGFYSVLWDIGEEPLTPENSASDTIIVGPSTALGTNLVTVDEMMVAKNQTEVEPGVKARYELAAEHASAAVRTFCDRTFGLPLETASKTYEYEDYGFVDIDDAHHIDEVVFVFGGHRSPIREFYWRPEPQAGPPYTYLTVPHWAGIYSPEMGFTYNLDVISKDRGWPGLIPLVEVTGSWGWNTTPLDVKRAALLTAIAFADTPEPYLAESVGTYSYQSAIRQGAEGIPDLTPSAIPGRAQDLLMAYVRFQV